MINDLYIATIFLMITVIILVARSLLYRLIENNERRNYIKNFADYATVLEFYEERAYDIIYKDKLLVYSLEATKVNDKEFQVISKDFSKLVLRLLGPTLQEEFEKMFGLDALFINMMEYFNRRYEDDEVRHEATNTMMEKDIEEQK